jgi:hypothetical protein
LDRIGQQLQHFYNLQKKHQVSTTGELHKSRQLSSVFELGNLRGEIENLTLAIQEKQYY